MRGGSSAYSIFLVTANTRAFSGATATEASTRLGPFGLDSQSRRLCRGTVQSTSCSTGSVKPRVPRYDAIRLVCSVTEGGVRYS